tara:strand:- start:22250 stop:22468 length:219 start_codon:yes stop_codon:yes gene_type:complete
MTDTKATDAMFQFLCAEERMLRLAMITERKERWLMVLVYANAMQVGRETIAKLNHVPSAAKILFATASMELL